MTMMTQGEERALKHVVRFHRKNCLLGEDCPLHQEDTWFLMTGERAVEWLAPLPGTPHQDPRGESGG